MKAKIVRMGNSVGICIPKIILEQCHMDTFVDIQILEDKLIINPVNDETKKSLSEKISLSDTKTESLCWYEDDTEWK